MTPFRFTVVCMLFTLSNIAAQESAAGILFFVPAQNQQLYKCSCYVFPISMCFWDLCLTPSEPTCAEVGVTGFVSNLNTSLVLTKIYFALSYSFNTVLYCALFRFGLFLQINKGVYSLKYNHTSRQIFGIGTYVKTIRTKPRV